MTWLVVLGLPDPVASAPLGDPIAGPDDPSPGAHRKLLYDSDFSYLANADAAATAITDLGGALKELPVGPRRGVLDLGGQVRMQYNHEIGMGQGLGAAQGRFQDDATDHWLTRLRLLGNWLVADELRLYREPHYAGTTTDEGGFVPRSFDGNYGDFLNGFADWKVAEGAVVRVGRQELIYGAERTVSVTNWQNSRRTFEGGRLLTTFVDWKADFFYTAFVPVRPTDLDQADWQQPFYGC